MSHMVIFRSADGRPGYHQADELEDAAGYVERLRNEQGVEHARIFRMEEVPFGFRPYYRVELNGEEPVAAEEQVAAPLAEAPPAPAAEPAPEAVAETYVAPVPEATVAEAPMAPVGSMAPAGDPDAVPLVPLGGNGTSVAGRRGLFGR